MPKRSNRKMRVQRTLDLRRGNRAQPIPSGRVYARKPKHTAKDETC